MSSIVAAYRPLRRQIERYRLDDTLAVVHAYSQYLAYRVPFPPTINAVHEPADREKGVYQWELEIIAREAIAHAPQSIFTVKTLRRAQNLAELVAAIRRFENQIAEDAITSNNVMAEIHRISHRQFEWQSDIPERLLLLRYYKIFAHPATDAFVRAEFGMDTKTLYRLGLLHIGQFHNDFAVPYPEALPYNHLQLTSDHLTAFLAHFCRPVADLKEFLKNDIAAHLDDTFTYFFDSLRTYPLIDMRVTSRRSLVAPLPVLMIWRFTRGLYYELCSQPRFGNAFGASFQRYVGDVLTDLFTNTRHDILPEEQTANDRGVPSSDWFLILDDTALVIETKTKRLGLAAKMALNDLSALDRELGTLADAVLQAYKCIHAMRANRFSGSVYTALAARRLYPVIVTLENWRVFGPMWQRLCEFVRQRLGAAGLPVEWTDTIPFSICDIDEFENLVRAIRATDSISGILDDRLTSAEFQQYEFSTYLHTQRKSALTQAQELFPNQFAADV